MAVRQTHLGGQKPCTHFIPDTFGDTLDIGIGAAYLVGNLSNIIDEDAPVEDCTTKYYPAERKKNHGSVMGGM